MAFVVPGRIEVLGKHTDYAGGRSLTAATRQGFRVVAAARRDRRLRLFDCGMGDGEPVELEIGATARSASRRWLLYPLTVAGRLAADFPPAALGADLAFASDLPPAAGLASSSAFVTAIFLVLARLGELGRLERFRAAVSGDEALAGYLGAIENGRAFGGLSGRAGVGTRGGSEDHTAIVCSLRGHLGQYAYLPVRRERTVPMPAEHLFAVASSGIAAEKTGAAREAYNRAARLAAEAAAAWRAASGSDEETLAAALAAAGSVERLIAAVWRGAPDSAGERLTRRARHFAEEHGELVPAAGAALAAGDLRLFGDLADRSQALAEELLDNQIRETIHLAASARRLGAAAASAFGAGFGGSVWALVGASSGDDFLARWRDDYLSAFPGHEAAARFFTTGASAGAREIVPRGRRIPAFDSLLAEGAAP